MAFGIVNALARSAEIDRPDGVTRCFQVSRYKIEPLQAKRARNLLPNNSVRATLLDEMVAGGPKVPLISKPKLLACRAERLTREAGAPESSGVGDAGATGCKTPYADSGAEMYLRKSGEFSGSDVSEIARVNFTIGNKALTD